MGDGLIFGPVSALGHQFCEPVFAERVAQRRKNPVVLLLLGTFASSLEGRQTRVNVTNQTRRT